LAQKHIKSPKSANFSQKPQILAKTPQISKNDQKTAKKGGVFSSIKSA